MDTTLADWPRPLYQLGPHKPFLFYVVFGVDSSALSVSSSKHRCAGIPDGLSLQAYGSGSNPEVVDQFKEGYLWDELCRESPDFAKQIASQDRCIVLHGEVDDDASLNYLRDAIGLITAMLDAGGVAVLDSQRFEWWTEQAWRERVFEGALADPDSHVVILASREADGSTWYHTRGMRKFGRPDLSMHAVSAVQDEVVIGMFNRFIRMQAQGAVVPEGQRISMAGLPGNLYCRHRGHMDDPDFNNVHIEIEAV